MNRSDLETVCKEKLTSILEGLTNLYDDSFSAFPDIEDRMVVEHFIRHSVMLAMIGQVLSSIKPEARRSYQQVLLDHIEEVMKSTFAFDKDKKE